MTMTDSEFCAECEKREGKIGEPYLLSEYACPYTQACLWERHVREWLERRDTRVEHWAETNIYCVYDSLAGMFLKADGGWTDNGDDAMQYVTYQTALLAAVDAVTTNKEKGNG
jgi:hypothetical protein